MKRFTGIALVGLLAFALVPAQARGGISATATISSQQLSPSSYQYSLTLTNTGTTAIGTFWFAWFPAYDLLSTAPTGFSNPAGWTGVNAPDSFGVASAQWMTTTSALQPGNSLSGFAFTTSETPAQIGGTSAFFGVPVEETYVYIGAPETQTDPGFALTPTTVPEPASLAMLLGVPCLLIRRKRR
jgi:hypothetical protein